MDTRERIGLAAFGLSDHCPSSHLRCRPRPRQRIARTEHVGQPQLFRAVSLPSGDCSPREASFHGSFYTNRADIFSVAGRSFSETAAMPASHGNSKQAMLLGNGKVLIAGNQGDTLAPQSHLFTEATHSWSATVNHPVLNRFSAAITCCPVAKCSMPEAMTATPTGRRTTRPSFSIRPLRHGLRPARWPLSVLVTA